MTALRGNALVMYTTKKIFPHICNSIDSIAIARCFLNFKIASYVINIPHCHVANTIKRGMHSSLFTGQGWKGKLYQYVQRTASYSWGGGKAY